MSLEKFLGTLQRVKQIGPAAWKASCPVVGHGQGRGDIHPSLSIGGSNGKLVIHCPVGCAPDDVVAAAGFTWQELLPPKETTRRKYTPPNGPKIVAIYDYTDDAGTLLYQTVRYEPKDFKQRRPDPDHPDKWIWNLKETPRVLYRLPELKRAIATGETIHIVEGEKDVDNLLEIGITATCNVGGAGKWKSEYSEALRGATVIVIPDNDRVGREHATQVYEEINGIAETVKIIPLPGNGKDVSDWIAAGGTREELDNLSVADIPATEPVSSEPDGVTPLCVRSAPLDTAKLFLDTKYQHDGVRTLHHNGGVFYAWTGTCYAQLDEDRIKAELYGFLNTAKTTVQNKDGTTEIVNYNPNRTKVGEVLDALKAAAYHPNAQPPRWLGEGVGSIYAEAELIAFSNGVLHVPTDTFLRHSPLFFNTNAVPFDYNPEVGDPVEWNKFLDDLWDDDLESRDTLQEIMGLLLLPDTKFQKIFGIVGPKRAGKGVIGRVMRGMSGPDNVAAPTLASLSTNFGLSSLIGKRVAIISDARLGGRTDQHQIAERLLSISGEDAIDIDRKFLPVWTGTLAVRFVILTNEVPRIADMSGALPSRLIFLEMKESFYGKEDLGLTAKLLNELPAIALWSIQGWKRLQERGYFLQPSAAREVIREMEDLSSPVGAFVRECCVMGVGKETIKQQMFKAFQMWSKDGGKTFTATDATFGRDLMAATHRKVTSRQPRDAGERQRVYAGITLTPDWLTRVQAQERLEVLEDLRRTEKAERKYT